MVKKATGFKVIYGPVAARHIPEFLANGLSAHKKMRQKRFGLYERAVLTPMELLPGLRLGLPVAVLAGILTAFLWPGALMVNIKTVGGLIGFYILWSLLMGTVLGPYWGSAPKTSVVKKRSVFGGRVFPLVLLFMLNLTYLNQGGPAP
jgi:hypothetical protein